MSHRSFAACDYVTTLDLAKLASAGDEILF
jgi:hypothetical protein